LPQKLIISLFVLLASLQVDAQTNRVSDPVPATPIIRLFPNPATTYIQFEMTGNIPAAGLSIYNGVMGKKMLAISNVSGQLRINLNDFPRGLYVYHLLNANGQLLEVGKFQVSK
jgi:hypothetical protein